MNKIAPQGPEEVVLVTSRSEGKDNIIPVTWFKRVNYDPEIYMISIGKKRETRNMINKSRAFCLNFMDAKWSFETLFCGRVSIRDLDKFSKLLLDKGETEIIDCPHIKQADTFRKCKVINTLEYEDHTLFLGEVVEDTDKEIKIIDSPKAMARNYHTGLNRLQIVRKED